MADVAKVEKKRKKVLMIAGIAALIVLAAGAGVGLRLLQTKDEVAEKTLTGLPKVVDNLETLRDKGDEKAFNAALQNALKEDLDDDTKYLVHLQKGHLAMQNQQWQAAIDAYEDAMAIKEDKEVVALLADAYAALGNKAKAIEYYEKAIALVPDSNPNRDGIRDEYRLRIQELEEGTQP
jgi:uncharacterized protein HemY